MQNVDLTVVGGGFAGLSCAQAAASRGLHTVVLERKPAPWEAPHTTGILVKEVADEFDFPRRYTRKVAGIRLYSPALRQLDLTAPGYYFLATDTPAILRWLASEATAAGSLLRCDEPYAGSSAQVNAVALPRHRLRTRYLVGCDGALSKVAHAHRLGRNRRFLFGVEAQIRGLGGVAVDRLHVFIDPIQAPGYIGWVVPGCSAVQVGLAVRRPGVPDLGRFLHKLRRLFDFRQAEHVGYRAGLVPCGGPVRPFANGNVLLLGDAAGQVSPLTAGGIHPAMQLGRSAGIAIADYLSDGGPDPASVVRGSLPSYACKKALRTLYEGLPPHDGLFDFLFGLPWFRSIAQLVFYHHRGLFSLHGWRDLLRLGRTG